MDKKPTLAILGGSGDLGGGLARRWAKAGYPLVIGSRDPTKAAQVADEIRTAAGGSTVTGATNAAAAAAADIIVLAVPNESHDAMVATIRDAARGKIVVDTTVPLAPPKVSTVNLPPTGSIGKATQDALGPEVRVVAAFHNVAADHLRHDHGIDCDVLVFGNDAQAREAVVRLAADAGLKGWHAGVIANAVVGEALTSVLIFINRRYKIDGAGVRITGTPQPGAA